MRVLKGLKKEEELALGVKIQEMLALKEKLNGVSPSAEEAVVIRIGERAAERLVRANLQLVYKMASDFNSRINFKLERDEVVADGLLGLSRAVYKYDPARGNKFSTVATHWIHQAMARGVNNNYRLVRLPVNRVIDMLEIVKLKDSYAGQGLSEREVMGIVGETLGFDERLMKEILAAGSDHSSLNRLTEGGAEYIDFIPELGVVGSSEEVYITEESHRILSDALNSLNGLELDIIVSCFNLPIEGFALKKIIDIMMEYSLTRGEYKKILSNGVKKLETYFFDRAISFEDLIGSFKSSF